MKVLEAHGRSGRTCDAEGGVVVVGGGGQCGPHTGRNVINL